MISTKSITCPWLPFFSFWPWLSTAMCFFVFFFFSDKRQMIQQMHSSDMLTVSNLFCTKGSLCDRAGPGLSPLLSDVHVVTLGRFLRGFWLWRISLPSACYQLHIWHCQFSGTDNSEIYHTVVNVKLRKAGDVGGLQEAAVRITKACVWALSEEY